MSELNDQAPSSLARNIRNLALIMLLFLFPLVSWYYLNSGLNYQKEARAELKEYGQIPAFDLETQYNFPFTKDSLKGKISVLHFFSLQDEKTDRNLDKISSIYDQFKERKDVCFLNFCLDQNIDPNFSFRSYGIDKKLHDKEQCFFLTGGAKKIEDMCVKVVKSPILSTFSVSEGYQLEERAIPSNQSYPFLVLVDEKHRIRNYYPLDDARAMGRLVEHLAMTLPRTKKEGTIMVRDREK